jgi:hypothetical protein
MQTVDAKAFAESIVDDIFNDSRESRATISLIGPLPNKGPTCVINVVKGTQIQGMRIPRNLFPLVVEAIKELIGADPKTTGVPISRAPLLKYFQSFGGDCKFEVSVLKNSKIDQREVVQIFRKV